MSRNLNPEKMLRQYAKTATRAFVQTLKAMEAGDCKTAQKHYLNGQRRYGVAYGMARVTAAPGEVNVTRELERAGAAMQPAREAFKGGCEIRIKRKYRGGVSIRHRAR